MRAASANGSMVLAFGALGCAFAGWQRISAWAAGTAAPDGPPVSRAAALAPWLLLGALAAVGGALLAAL